MWSGSEEDPLPDRRLPNSCGVLPVEGARGLSGHESHSVLEAGKCKVKALMSVSGPLPGP